MTSNDICVIGLGRVGLVLACILADLGFRIYGIEANGEKRDSLVKGKVPYYEQGLDDLLKRLIKNESLLVHHKLDPEVARTVEAYIVCVGTGINLRTKKPLLTDLTKALTDIGKHLKKEDLVVVRSTVPVGTVGNVVRKILEKISGLSAGKDFCLAFAPERMIEGRALKESRSLPQIIGGIDEESLNRAARIFEKVTKTTVRVSSLEVAEMIKIIDNTYRIVNIALGNEIGLLCEVLGVDAYEVVNAANYAYPRNKVMVPGAGVGGSCLVKDPWYLMGLAKERGLTCSSSIIRLAARSRNTMSNHVIELVREGLGEIGKEVKGSKILILGFAYKGDPPTDDTRFAPTEFVVRGLKEMGAELIGYDPVVSPNRIKIMGAKPARSIAEGAKGASCITIMTNSRMFNNLNLEELKKHVAKKCVIVDGWHMINRRSALTNRFHYLCLGVG
ncbi:MAG: nucleotide sugar dehydrogenase [Promethearchaeota archaeon]